MSRVDQILNLYYYRPTHFYWHLFWQRRAWSYFVIINWYYVLSLLHFSASSTCHFGRDFCEGVVASVYEKQDFSFVVWSVVGGFFHVFDVGVQRPSFIAVSWPISGCHHSCAGVGRSGRILLRYVTRGYVLLLMVLRIGQMCWILFGLGSWHV